jgi:hypothetical protein
VTTRVDKVDDAFVPDTLSTGAAVAIDVVAVAAPPATTFFF